MRPESHALATSSLGNDGDGIPAFFFLLRFAGLAWFGHKKRARILNHRLRHTEKINRCPSSRLSTVRNLSMLLEKMFSERLDVGWLYVQLEFFAPN
jgi:hypothetical protein